MIRKIVALAVLLFFGWILLVHVEHYFPFGDENRVMQGVAKEYVEKGVKQTHAVNVITAIVTFYRGFDTLGEVTVLFLAATGLGIILSGLSRRREEEEEEKSPTLIMCVAARYLFPLILLFGAYVFIHGHLTPGGGFPAGVIIATGYLLCFIATRGFKPSHILLSAVESFAGSLYVIVGLLGLTLGISFLDNVLPLGKINTVFSAGIIPVIYIIIGFKVGSEMTGLLENMKEESK